MPWKQLRYCDISRDQRRHIECTRLAIPGLPGLKPAEIGLEVNCDNQDICPFGDTALLVDTGKRNNVFAGRHRRPQSSAGELSRQMGIGECMGDMVPAVRGRDA
jgi:hypothetical protein